MELKRQVYPKVVNNYYLYPKVFIKPYEYSLTNFPIFSLFLSSYLYKLIGIFIYLHKVNIFIN